MIHREYLVRMPPSAGSLDIVLGLPGSIDAPVAGSGFSGTRTPAPSGWLGGSSALSMYFEWRGRPVRIPSVYGDADFSPLFRLGWSLSVQPWVNGSGGRGTCFVSFSKTLLGNITMPGISGADPIADPSYGPVIRLSGNSDVENTLLNVQLKIATERDEDRLLGR